MGRRMKQLSQLDDQECQWILGVIHRDFQLRHREQQRLSKIERELNEQANQRNLLAKRREFNEKCCILCCATFNLLFNKRLPCAQCKLFVCRNCATWESQDKKWLCRVCEQQRVLYVQSCEWFYDHIKKRFKHFGSAKVLDTLRRKRKESGVDSENDSGYGPATSEGFSLKSSPLAFLLPHRTHDRTKASGEDNATAQPAGHSNGEEEEEEEVIEESSEVRRHIETVVEGLVGENLDTARVDRPFLHPQYLQLFSSYHTCLVEAITKLCQALDIALNNKPVPPGGGDEGACSVTPTTAHACLKQTILDVAQQAASLPHLQEQAEQSPAEQANGNEFTKSCFFHSYQELLASAIINKLVERSQKQHSPNQRINREDSELSDISDTDIHMNSASKDRRCSDQSGGSESESLETDSSLGGVDAADDEFSWATGIKAGDSAPPRIEYVIEECIEEITEEEFTDAEGNRSHQRQEVKQRKPTHRTATRQHSGVDDPVNKATFEVPLGSSVPDLDFLNAWDLVESRRVPFPEFGVDIVQERPWDEDDEYYGDEPENEEVDGEGFDDVGSRRSSVTAWEENWLFRKRKMFPFGGMRHQLLGFYGEPPCMLIPNPREAVPQAQIDARDVDQLSELSEQNSVGSLEFTDSESESEFSGSHKLVELAQNVAQHFNSNSGASSAYSAQYCSVSKSSVPLTRKLGSDIKPAKPARKVSTSKQPDVRIPVIEECLSVPIFVPPNNRTTSGRDPVIVNPPESLTLHAGKVAQFQCHVIGTKPLGVSWFKGDRLLQESDNVEVHQRSDDGRFILNIFETDAEDAGCYSCVAYNTKAQHWVDFNIQIKGTSRAKLPPEFVVPLRISEWAEKGGTLRLTCTLGGYPEPRLLIFRNKQLVTNSPKHSIQCQGYGEWCMAIHQAESSDEGEYEAFASNRLGHALSLLRVSLGVAPTEAPKPTISKAPEVVKEIRKPEVKGRQRPHVIQRTWLERCANMEPKGKVNRFLLAPLEHSQNGVHDLSPPSPAPQDLSCPPRPGTIAEREHRKWETAAPLANNPYSSENMTKRRLERRISDISLTDPVLSYEEFERQREANQTSGHLDSSERYGRDYYINLPASSNSSLTSGSRRNSGLLNNGIRDDSLDALQDKVYLSADQVSSLEGQVRLLEQELERASGPGHLEHLQSQVARTVAQVDNSSRQVSRVECEVRRLRKTLSSDSDHSKLSYSSHSDVAFGHQQLVPSLTSEEEGEDPATLPSVKHLANLFAHPTNDNHNLNGVHSKGPYQEKDVVIVEKDSLPATSSSQAAPPQHSQVAPKYKVANQGAPPPPRPEGERANQERAWPLVRQLSRSFDNNNNDSGNEGLPTASVQRVHSLTARSMSKEFRQEAARHAPRPMNRTVSVVSPSSGSSSSQPTSLDTERSASPITNNNTIYNSNNNLSLPPPVFPASTRHISDSGHVGSGGGYTSDESSASNTSLPRNSSAKRRPISKAILQRATYWERRAEQGLLSDNSVSEEFPANGKN